MCFILLQPMRLTLVAVLLQSSAIATASSTCAELPTGKIQLKAAIDRALCLEPAIAQSRASVAFAASVLQEQEAAKRPALDAVVPATTSAQRSDGQTTHSSTASATLNLQYLWLDGGAREQRIDQRSRELLASQQDLIVQTQEVVLSFVSLWADTMDAIAVRNAAQTSLAAAKSSLASAQARLQAGTGTRVDVLSAQSSVAQAERDLLVAQSNAVQRARTLSQRLQIDVAAVQELQAVTDSDVIALLGEQTPTQPDVRHPQLLAQRERVTAAQAAVQATEAAEGATVSLSGKVGPAWSRGNDTITGATTTVNRLSSEIGISLTVPLSDGGAKKARTAQARAQLDSQRAQLQGVERQLQETLDQKQTGWDSARADLRSTQVALDAATLAENAQRARFDVGLGTLNELLTAQNDVAARSRQFANAQSQLLRAAAELAAARGVLYKPFIYSLPTLDAVESSR
jgi:outer membrane protein